MYVLYVLLWSRVLYNVCVEAVDRPCFNGLPLNFFGVLERVIKVNVREVYVGRGAKKVLFKGIVRTCSARDIIVVPKSSIRALIGRSCHIYS